jgi:hypothetical protein
MLGTCLRAGASLLSAFPAHAQQPVSGVEEPLASADFTKETLRLVRLVAQKPKSGAAARTWVRLELAGTRFSGREWVGGDSFTS